MGNRLYIDVQAALRARLARRGARLRGRRQQSVRYRSAGLLHLRPQQFRPDHLRRARHVRLRPRDPEALIGSGGRPAAGRRHTVWLAIAIGTRLVPPRRQDSSPTGLEPGRLCSDVRIPHFTGFPGHHGPFRHQLHPRSHRHRAVEPGRAQLRHLFAAAARADRLRDRRGRGPYGHADHRPVALSRVRESRRRTSSCTSTRRAEW